MWQSPMENRKRERMHTKSKEESRFEWQSHNSNLWQILVLTKYISPGEMSMNEGVSDYGNMWKNSKSRLLV